MTHSPTILALDFDGVICNGLREYFQTSQRTYQQVWQADDSVSLDDYAERFYKLRPVIETGWEMPLLIRAMVLGVTDQQILHHWSQISADLMAQEKLDKTLLIQTLDQVRDHWIHTDLAGWLSLHQFYEGVLEKLNKVLASSTKLYIITTKEGRFVQQLLKDQGLEVPETAIYGKEVKRPKAETLQEILKIHSENAENLWFVEDLLKTLQSVANVANLQAVKLYLAAWGYNTPSVRDSLKNQSRIQLLSLEQFSQDFAVWR